MWLVDQLESNAAFRRAVSAELIHHGLRLRWLTDGTDRLEWEDVWDLLLTAGQKPIVDFLDPDQRGWDVNSYLLANVIDLLAGANWQRGGGKGSYPAAFPRPGATPQNAAQGSTPGAGGETAIPQQDEPGVYMGEALPIEDMKAWLGRD